VHGQHRDARTKSGVNLISDGWWESDKLTFVTSEVLPDPLGPQTRNLGNEEGAFAR
jgi:hypothetical protein